jgi:hypothetical protein
MTPRQVPGILLLSVTIRGILEHVANVHRASRIAMHPEVIHVHRGMIANETMVREMIDRPVNEDKQIEDKSTDHKRTCQRQIEHKRQTAYNPPTGQKANSQNQKLSATGLLVNDPVELRSLSDLDRLWRMISGQVWREPFLQFLPGRNQLGTVRPTMKTMILMQQTPNRKRQLDRMVSDDLDAVGDAAEDAVGEQTAVAMIPLLLKRHLNDLA